MGWLDLVDCFNWVDRAHNLVASALNWRHGGLVALRVTRLKTGPSGADCEALLKRYHVPIAGRRVTSKYYVFSVRRQQAAWAEYLLRRAGVPLETTVDPRNAGWAAQHNGRLPTRWDDRKGR